MHDFAPARRLMLGQVKGGQRVRRLLVLVWALLLLVMPAGASLYRGPDLAAGWFKPGKSLGIGLTARLDAWPDVHEQTLAALNAFLADARLELATEQNKSLLKLSRGGETLLSLLASGEDALTVDIPGRLEATRYLSAGQPPWMLLFGGDSAMPDFVSAGKALNQLATQVKPLPLLLPEAKPVKTSITIKNAGKGVSQLVYTLDVQKARLFWNLASPRLLTQLDRLFASLVPERREAWTGALRALDFKGPLTVKRYLDKDGADLGFQITASLALGGQTRKLTLFYGQSASGLYLSFKLPATRGNDTLELQLSLAYTEAGVKGDWRYRHRLKAEREDASGELSLKHADGRLTGNLEFELRRPDAAIPAQRFLFSPDLAFSDTGFSGTLRAQAFAGKTLRQDALLTLEGQEAAAFTPPEALAEITLDGDALPSMARARLDAALASLINAYLQELPLETRLLALHDLGRERRAEGESVPVPPAVTEAPFTVIAEPLPTTPKEETP